MILTKSTVTNFIGGLFALAIIIITFLFQYYLSIDMDKYFALIVASLIYIYLLWFLLNGASKLSFTKEFQYLALGTFALLILYFLHFTNYGILFNVQVLTLLTILYTPLFYKFSKQFLNYEIFFKYILFGYLLILIPIMIFQSDGYSIKTGGFSSNLFFLVFCISFHRNSNTYKLLRLVCLIAIFLLQVRIHLLSVLVIYAFIFLKKESFIKLLIYTCAFLIFIYILYIYSPGLRIFEIHTSGRLVHWNVILNNFELGNIFTGMGAGASRQVLFDHGISESMGSAHNEFIRYGYDLGLLGLFALFCILRILFIRKEFFTKLIVLTIILQMITDNIFTYYFNYLLPLILFCYFHDEANINIFKNNIKR